MSLLFRTSLFSRERNRVHAQRTRQRKKEQMLHLQEKANVLKAEQLKLRQAINEQNTANILVGIFAHNSTSGNALISPCEDSKVEDLLKRSVDDIPDASKIPGLQKLSLPRLQGSRDTNYKQELIGLEGIDFKLLERDRSECTMEQLDKIRRERNRMHAKRTRDRKRLFIENLGEILTTLEAENNILKKYLLKIDPENGFFSNFSNNEYAIVSSADSSCCGLPSAETSPRCLSSGISGSEISSICLSSSFANSNSEESECGAKRKDSLYTLLQAAGCYEEKQTFDDNVSQTTK